MHRVLPTLLLLLLAGFSSFGQSTITLKGKIIDESTKLPLESATVYLTSAKDSTIIDYTISDKNGSFSLPTRKITKPAFLKVSFMGYEDYKQEIPELLANKDFGQIFVLEQANALGEVVVKGEAPPVRIKKDTLEFNASSFKVRPDANVEALLKQLPGVEITSDGKITVNGKEVNNILVNGKPFFGKDGKIATENLPAEIIDKVQITDTKTKEEELSGDAASSQEKTINLTIQEDKNKGLFGKFSGGMGTDERYEASGLVNYFKNDQKISVLGSSNNINSVGFSMDEIFDAMGGGRNFYSSGDGSFGVDGMRFGGGTGITESGMIGLNYADKWFKKLDAGGSYFYTNSVTNNDNRSRVENFLTGDAPGGNSFLTESSGSTKNTNDGHNLNLDFEYKIDSMTTLSIRPKLTKNTSEYRNSFQQSSTNDLGLINQTTSDDASRNENVNFENQLYFNRRFKKKGRALGLTFNNTHKDDDADNITKSETYYFQDPALDDDIRNQRRFNKRKEEGYYMRIGYSEPITDSLSLTFRAAYTSNKKTADRSTFNFNDANNQYSILNDSLSYSLDSRTQIVNPNVAINIRKKKYSMGLSLGTQLIKFENTSLFVNTAGEVNKSYIYPSANLWLNYNISKSKSAYVYYSFDVNMPTAEQLLPIVDLSNPLSRITGNPNLEPEKSHNLYLNFNNYDYASKSGFYLYGGTNYYEQQIVMSTVFNPTDLISRTEFQNIENMASGYMGFSMDKTVKTEGHSFRFSTGLSSNFNYSKGLTNNSLYKAKGYQLTPNVGITWDYGDLLSVTPSYRYTFNRTDFTNYMIDNTSNFTHSLKLETTSRWPKRVVFGNDFGYNYNSNIADGFQKDFYLWNMSLGYNFFGDKLLAKVKVYDLLNQNVNATRTITPTAIQDVENTVLRRYAMFSLTYKIEKFGGKKKNAWEE